MRTISLSFEFERLVSRERVSRLYATREMRRSQLAEAQGVLGNAHLVAWVPEATSLVARLSAQLAEDEARVARFEETVGPLERAIEVETAARSEWERAKAARGVGALKRTDALKLRDDVEHADQVLLVRRRETASCLQDVSARLQSGGVYRADDAQAIVAGLERRVLARAFSMASGAIEQATWHRWFESPDSEVAWVPFFAARTIAAAAKESEALLVRTPSGDIRDPRRDDVVLPVAVFVEELARFKSNRAAHLLASVDRARRSLELARERAAALNEGSV